MRAEWVWKIETGIMNVLLGLAVIVSLKFFFCVCGVLATVLAVVLFLSVLI